MMSTHKNTTGIANEESDVLAGKLILQEIKRSNVEFIIAVPDIVTSAGLLWPISRDKDLRLVRVCKEDEGVSICGALSFSNRRALLLIQQTGFLDSINAIRAIGMEYEMPICMMIGLQGKEPNLMPHESSKYSVRVVEPILDAMGLKHYLIQNPKDFECIVPAIDEAYRNHSPVALLVGKPVV